MWKQRGHSNCQIFESSGTVRRVLWQSCRLFGGAYCLHLHGSTTLFSQQPPDEGRKLVRQASHLPTYAASGSARLFFFSTVPLREPQIPANTLSSYLCLYTDANAGINFTGSTRRGLNCRGNVPNIVPIFKSLTSKRWLSRKSLEWCGCNLMFST